MNASRFQQFAIGLSLAVLSAGAGAHSSPQSTNEANTQSEVALWGDLRLIATDRLIEARPFAEFAQREHLYGIGMPTGLTDELLVVDGKPFLGRFQDLSYRVTSPRDFDVAFFAFAYVPEWREIPVPESVTGFEDFERFLVNTAESAGLDLERGFTFRLLSDFRAVNWFVVDGMGNLDPDPLRSFLRRRYLGGLDDRRIEAVGVYATALQGIATAPSTPMHLHFRTVDDGPAFVGHVDNNFLLSSGATLYLPMKSAQ